MSISLGSVGNAVSNLQEALLRAGFDPQGADGDFGSLTLAAVRGFQAARGLPVTGIADDATLAALRSPAAPPAPVARPNFYEATIKKSPAFHSTDICNSLSMLEPVTRGAVSAILADAAAAGTPLIVFETFRSVERQQLLFKQGATQLRNVGVHHYGLAADLVKNVGGQPSWKGSFDFLRVLANKYGLISGADWGQPNVRHSFIDADHVQRCTIAEQAGLFAGTWYPPAIVQAGAKPTG